MEADEESKALRELAAVATGLDPVQVELLTEIARTMMRRVVEAFYEESDFATPRFRANFRNRLLIHHATNEAKLTKKAFEFAFLGASKADSKIGFITTSSTLSGADVIVDNVRFSLKTEAARGIKAEQITISKFTEARWIQQQTTLKQLAEEAAKRIPAHLSQYDRILILRVREMPKGQLLYEIVEIPIDLLRRIGGLTEVSFSPRTTQGGSSAKIVVEGQPAFTLRLDGSDGKITITGLPISMCIRHVSWIIPTVAPAPEDTDTAQSLFSPPQPPSGD